MAKTRRQKTNRSPGRAFRNATTHVLNRGDTVKTAGVRGRTVVKRVTNEIGKRLTTVRLTEDVRQLPAPAKATGIFVGRVYTGVARSKPYPYRGKKRGAPDVVLAPGLMARVGRAIKRVRA